MTRLQRLFISALPIATLVFPAAARAQEVGDLRCNDTSIATAIGCVSLDPASFAGQILTLSVSLGGGVALVLLLYGFLTLAMSGGVPDKVNSAKEIITSAIGGLILITTATVLMGFIGINILNLPGLQ